MKIGTTLRISPFWALETQCFPQVENLLVVVGVAGWLHTACDGVASDGAVYDGHNYHDILSMHIITFFQIIQLCLQWYIEGDKSCFCSQEGEQKRTPIPPIISVCGCMWVSLFFFNSQEKWINKIVHCIFYHTSWTHVRWVHKLSDPWKRDGKLVCSEGFKIHSCWLQPQTCFLRSQTTAGLRTGTRFRSTTIEGLRWSGICVHSPATLKTTDCSYGWKLPC